VQGETGRALAGFSTLTGLERLGLLFAIVVCIVLAALAADHGLTVLAWIAGVLALLLLLFGAAADSG